VLVKQVGPGRRGRIRQLAERRLRGQAQLDRDGLVKYFPSERFGSDSLTAYLLSIASEAGWEIPAKGSFGLSLLLMIASLIVSAREIQIAVQSIELHIHDLLKENK
jgi:hypothetical protein